MLYNAYDVIHSVSKWTRERDRAGETIVKMIFYFVALPYNCTIGTLTSNGYDFTHIRNIGSETIEIRIIGCSNKKMYLNQTRLKNWSNHFPQLPSKNFLLDIVPLKQSSGSFPKIYRRSGVDISVHPTLVLLVTTCYIQAYGTTTNLYPFTELTCIQ